MPANTLGTLSPTVVTLDVIQYLKKKFPMLTRVATDFSKDAVLLNQNVISRVVTPPPTHDYVAPSAGGTGYASQDGAATTDVPVTINKHKFVSLSFSATELSSTRRNLLEEQKSAAAYALGRQAAIDLWALVTPTNFTQKYAIKAANNAARNTVTQMRQILVTAGADVNRFGICNPTVFSALSEDLGVISRFNFGSVDPNFNQGSIEGLAGFDAIDEYAELNTANSLLGFFGAKESMIFAARVPQDPTTVIDIPLPGRIEYVTDPDSGLSLMYQYWYDFNGGQLNMVLSWMYGVAIGVPEHGSILVLDPVNGNPS
jgi:hypothetical protein